MGKSSVAFISFNSVSKEKFTKKKESPVTEMESEKPGTVDGRRQIRWLRKWGWEEGIWVWMEEGFKLLTFSFKRMLSYSLFYLNDVAQF
jgi:hypothetical protein